jgi:small subunit ribosomal protein S6
MSAIDRNVTNYEAMVILNPAMTETETEALVGRMAGILTEGGATLRETARWGRRRLAQPIDKKAEGYYVIYYFTHDDAARMLAAFERFCRYEEQVLRHMVVKVPTRKRGQEVAQLVPAPGWLADFRIEPRAHAPRRRSEPPRPFEPPIAGAESAEPGAAATHPEALVAAPEATAEAPDTDLEGPKE